MIYHRKIKQVEAIQFKEISRIKCKHGDAVEYNDSEIFKFMGATGICRTEFPPHLEGMPMITNDEKHILMVGDYCVSINGGFDFIYQEYFEERYLIPEVKYINKDLR